MLSINYNYYNNLEAFKIVRDHYLHLPNYGYKFNIVDDGSQIPIPESEMPDHWNHFRILEDLGCNESGARNLYMQETETKWNVCIDLDRVLSPKLYAELNDFIDNQADENICYRFWRIPNKKKICPNDIFLTKDLFWSKMGYAESLRTDKNGIRYWGVDKSFLKQVNTEPLLELSPTYSIFDYIELTDEEYEKRRNAWDLLGLEEYDDGLRVNFKWKKVNANISN
tara:strand:+ start:195 stop:869 length:675 start_codon:yes stop_codon:yes gene_type:complete